MVPVELDIRHFMPGDIDALHFLLGDALPTAARPRFADLVSLLLAEDVAAMVAAVADVATVQLAGALVLRGDAAQSRVVVHLVAVHPDYRRLGLGRRLMTRALAVARGNGWSSVICPAGNAPAAAAFFLAMGFAPAGAEAVDSSAGWRRDLVMEA
jgi:GNAT superfamily N-acetyltransferase